MPKLQSFLSIQNILILQAIVKPALQAGQPGLCRRLLQRADRFLQGRSGGGELRDFDADQSSLPRAAFDLQAELGAIENAKTLPDVAEADTFYVDVRHALLGDADAVVFDFDLQAAAALLCVQADAAAFDLGREAVLEAVLHHRLQQHARNERLQRLVVDFLDDLEVVLAEAGHLDVQIVVDELQFFFERNEGFVFAQDAAQDVAEFEHNAPRSIGINPYQSGNGVERVEQKMRVDLA